MVKITINDNVTKLKEKSKSKNTQDKYEGDWLKFIEYCKSKYKCNPLEVDDLDSAFEDFLLTGFVYGAFSTP